MSIKYENSLQLLEKKVTSFLQSYAKDEDVKNKIAPHVAKISLKQNHLYQDLEFKNRAQMGRFMKENFPNLAKLKPKEKLWKKFIYDSIKEVAPACKQCSDQITCFACKV